MNGAGGTEQRVRGRGIAICLTDEVEVRNVIIMNAFLGWSVR